MTDCIDPLTVHQWLSVATVILALTGPPSVAYIIGRFLQYLKEPEPWPERGSH